MLASAHLYLAVGGLLCLASPKPNAPATQAPAAGAAHRICWQEGRRLQWSDFRAKSFPKSAQQDSSNLGALSATVANLVPLVKNGVRTYQVYSKFLRDSSWVNNQAMKTPKDRNETLTHEQLHFDIRELTARRMRQRIAQGVANGEDLYEAKAVAEITDIQSDSTLDDVMDYECALAGGHKTASSVTKRWQLRLARELSALAAYKSTATDCP